MVCGGITESPLVLCLKKGLSRAVPNASFSPEIQELRTRLPSSPFWSDTLLAQGHQSWVPAVGGSPGGPGKGDESKDVQLWLGCSCSAWMCWLSLCEKLCHLSSLPFQLPPFMLSLSAPFGLGVFSSLLIHPILPADAPFPSCTYHTPHM